MADPQPPRDYLACSWKPPTECRAWGAITAEATQAPWRAQILHVDPTLLEVSRATFTLS